MVAIKIGTVGKNLFLWLVFPSGVEGLAENTFKARLASSLGNPRGSDETKRDKPARLFRNLEKDMASRKILYFLEHPGKKFLFTHKSSRVPSVVFHVVESACNPLTVTAAATG
jgi:hypothetical protein